jgi:NADH dehydrogenase [ubiquinone] 1 alpha subcomplex assembly factor 6
VTRPSRPAPGLSPLAQTLRQHDRDRFVTTLFAPPGRRTGLVALYGFNYEIARIRDAVREPMLGQIRLQWWREAIAAIYDGAEPRRHEVLDELAPVIRINALSRVHFERLIDAREADLDEAPPEDMAGFEAYCRESSACLTWLALEILDASTPAANKAGEHVGIAFAAAGLLRAIPFQIRAGRFPIPARLGETSGLDHNSVRRMQPSPALERCVAALAGLARNHLAAARSLRREIPKSALPALLPAVAAESSLRRLERARYNVFDPTLLLPDGGRGWRLALAAASGRY